MPKLTLMFDELVISECSIGKYAVQIGRLPDNDIVVDNAGVSGRHARVFKQGDQVVIEDLKSTNGTFINNKPITSAALKDGDRILVGKHTIVYDRSGGDAAADGEFKTEQLAEIGGTMMLDTERHRELLSGAGMEAVKGPAAPPAKVGRLTVLEGRSDQTEYTLSSQTSMIGKAGTSLVRLKGWFKPKTALAIARKGDGYSATALGGKTLINGEPLTGRRDLKDGDVLQVSGLTLEFHLK
ncbi:MAG: FHA domain-containing protein [Vicinamibacterales bacterium]